MRHQERILIFIVLLINFGFVTVDLINDFKEHESALHLGLEFVPAIVTFGALLFISNEFARLRREGTELEHQAGQWEQEAEKWRKKTASLSQGIAGAIDEQMNSWQLTEAEKEIGLLILKGLSLKEIAEARSTTEQTVKQQTVAVYRKAGLSGRAELSAFFLEDLLQPSNQA